MSVLKGYRLDMIKRSGQALKVAIDYMGVNNISIEVECWEISFG